MADSGQRERRKLRIFAVKKQNKTKQRKTASCQKSQTAPTVDNFAHTGDGLPLKVHTI